MRVRVAFIQPHTNNFALAGLAERGVEGFGVGVEFNNVMEERSPFIAPSADGERVAVV
jgi:hypothetical protein